MEAKRDNPGVYVPPPLLYVAIFLAALILQTRFPISESVFYHFVTKILGAVLIAIAVFFLFRSLKQFFVSNNTVITMMPAKSLQTNGVYGITRNPMYVGLALVYLALTCFIGNWWNVILFPVLVLVVQGYVIKREENYLIRRFGQDYINYKAKVRRWL